MLRIPFIYADNCKHCQEALSLIKSAIKKCKNISCEIAEFPYNSKAAIAIARAQGINNLPGFVIGSTVFMGNDFTEKIIIEAIKRAVNGKT